MSKLLTCCGNFRRHLFAGQPVCRRCGVQRPKPGSKPVDRAQARKDRLAAKAKEWFAKPGTHAGLLNLGERGHIATDLVVVFACLVLGWLWLVVLP